MDDLGWMRRALELAERGRRTVSPNPLVGCVIVRDGVVVGEGWHERAGEPHAEVLALRAAGDRARGATAYVTLEPCAHEGRTGPCADALAAAGIGRVVVAVADPNPVAAGGAGRLRAAGVQVVEGVGAEAARQQNEVFLHGLATGRPFVVVKSAVSLDGRVAAADGSSQWLTGKAARVHAHALRAEVDAVLVGSGTVLADDPHLTSRLADHDGPQPLRVVLDSRARTTPQRRVCDDAATTLVLVGVDAPVQARAVLAEAGVEVAEVKAAARGGLDLLAVLAVLWDRDVRSVLVEGGTAVASAFLTAGLADKVVVHVAPLLLGAGGRPLLVGDGIGTLADAPRLRLSHSERVGNDVVLTCYPRVRAWSAEAAGEGSD